MYAKSERISRWIPTIRPLFCVLRKVIPHNHLPIRPYSKESWNIFHRDGKVMSERNRELKTKQKKIISMHKQIKSKLAFKE